MRTILTTLLFLTVILTACKKNNDVGDDPVRNETGYLLSQVIDGKDTTRFQYDNSNRLTGILHFNGTYNFRSIIESFQYNTNGGIASYKFTYNGSSMVSNVHNFSNKGDTIIKTSVNVNTTYGDAIKFIFSNDRIIETRSGGVSNGIILHSGFWDTTLYVYRANNLVTCLYRFMTPTYQPFDTFLYDNNYYNPYLLLGKHTWSLLIGPGRGIAAGESKNIPSVKTIATYWVSGTSLLSSGFYSFKVTAVESAPENPVLPKVIKYLADDGSEIISRYFYQKQK